MCVSWITLGYIEFVFLLQCLLARECDGACETLPKPGVHTQHPHGGNHAESHPSRKHPAIPRHLPQPAHQLHQYCHGVSRIVIVINTIFFLFHNVDFHGYGPKYDITTFSFIVLWKYLVLNVYESASTDNDASFSSCLSPQLLQQLMQRQWSGPLNTAFPVPLWNASLSKFKCLKWN